MRKRALEVKLHAREASVIEIAVGDRVQLDQLTPSPRGTLAKRHGDLIGPGSATIALPPGHYFFKTLTDANLRVVTGGVAIHLHHNVVSKDPPLPPPLVSSDTPPPVDLNRRGDEGTGELPALTVEQAERHS